MKLLIVFYESQFQNKELNYIQNDKKPIKNVRVFDVHFFDGGSVSGS